MQIEWWHWITLGFCLIGLELIVPSFTIIWSKNMSTSLRISAISFMQAMKFLSSKFLRILAAALVNPSSRAISAGSFRRPMLSSEALKVFLSLLSSASS